MDVALTRWSGPLSQLAHQVKLTANEADKGLRLLWRRRALFVTGIVMNGVVYLSFSLFIGGGRIVKPLVFLTLPALAAAVVATTAALQGSGGIAEEINGGTLEQTQLSPARPELLVLGRLGALAIEGVVAGSVLGVVFAIAFGLQYHVHLAAVIPALLTVADALGYGLLLLAMTVRIASIGAITHVFNMAVMFFGGMLVPVAVFPPAVETFTGFIPVALGVRALDATLAGEPLSATWGDGTLPWLLVHVAVSLSVGWAVYSTSVRRTRREGGFR